MIMSAELTVFLAVSLATATTSFQLGGSSLRLHPTKIRSSLTQIAAASLVQKEVEQAPSDSISVSSSSGALSFDKFDWLSHWYPVSWARDLPLNRPTQVTVFDTDYVVARVPQKNGEETVMAMEDRCPHKSAALSEGRITSNGNFQCAYHGWSFDGTDGTCVEIPQVVGSNQDLDVVSQFTGRASGTAVPAMISQGMVWLFPGGNLEVALLAPPPPVIPEMDMDEFRVTRVVRDFPIDWSILLENIMDPDHGLFAHGTKGFDLYSGSKNQPLKIEEELTNDGKGWKITGRVDAVEKLIKFDKSRRGKDKSALEEDIDKIPIATTTFVAPSHVVMGRRNRQTGNSTSLLAFWVCPVGSGRSRFMSVSISKGLPFSIPRWLVHMGINNFLDQDTYLLATQQKHVLSVEANTVQEMMKDGQKLPLNKSTKVRKNNYVYQSPSEKLGIRLGTFFDTTLNRVPKRVSTLLDISLSGALRQTPSREVILDRHNQHTRICPDSQMVVRNCNRMQRTCAVASLFVTVVKAWAMLMLATATVGSPSWVGRLNAIVKPAVVGWTLGVSAIASWLATKLRREFSFKYTNAYHNKDIDNIPSVWLDK
jgi:phenylpropionate dioxygenase-like ring-hydroxylating dioxygenase large terminal subunit